MNNLYGWTMSQNLPVNNFEWIKDIFQFNKDLIKIYKKESDKGYFLEVDVQYFEKLSKIHNDLPFLPERKKIEKVEKLVANFHDKTEYVGHIRNLKQALDHGLLFKKVHRVIKFNENVWLKPSIDMNTDLTIKAKNNLEKYFFRLINNAVIVKAMKNVRKHRDINLVATEGRRNYLVSKLYGYHTTKFFTENLLAGEMRNRKNKKILMNKAVHFGLSILELSKILMFENQYMMEKQNCVIWIHIVLLCT